MSEERELLRETVAALVDKHASPAAVRKAIESDKGYDESLWKLLCEQVGAAALVVPEELGGAGGELADAAVVLEELGRALAPTPLLGTTLAELALLSAGQPDTGALEALAEGTSSIGNGSPSIRTRSSRQRCGRRHRGRHGRRDAAPLVHVHRHPRRHHGPSTTVGAARAAGHRGHSASPRACRHCGDPGGGRTDRRRGEVPRPDRRIRQGPDPVRPADR